MSINPPNTLAYIGEIAIPYILRDFDPLPANNKFSVPTVWINPSSKKAWILVNLALGVANWLPIGGGTGTLTTITIPGSVVITPTAGNVNFLDGTNITITGSGDSITFTAAGGTSGIVTIDGDTGSITGATVSLLGNTSAANCGKTVSFTSSGATELDLNVTDADNNTLIGATAGDAITIGVNNTGLGQNVLPNLITGGNNIALGCSSGVSYTTSEDSNILIGNAGVIGESNIIRIGTQGSGPGLQNECFIAGIATVATSNSEFVTVDTTTGQLGSTLVVPGTGISAVVRQVFATSGTYTPTAGMMYCDIEVVGGGGGGGGCTTTSTGKVSAAAGGGGGGYASGIFTAASIGISQVIVIGSGGAGGAAGNNNGVTGGTSSVGILLAATGGQGGAGQTAGATSIVGGALGGTGTVGQILISGETSSFSLGTLNFSGEGFGFGGAGGASMYGPGAPSTFLYLNSSFSGVSANSYGGGGAGAACSGSGTQQAGGNGADGIVIVTEYVA